jgi:hypothetical protein
MVAPNEHYRVAADAGGSSLAPGVYRVVGVDDERVTLLAVGTPDGDRVHTGRIERVDRAALAAFEPTDSPDPEGVFAALGEQFGGVALTARYAPRRMARRPLQTVVGVVLYAVDAFDLGAAANLPGTVVTLAGVAGVVLLVAAAVGRP